MSAWTGKPCRDCGKKKSRTRLDMMRCTTCERAVKRERKDDVFDRRMQEQYGISAEIYWMLYEFQGGKCALCWHAIGKTKKLSVDHDHTCCSSLPVCGQCVRGLLCSNCNYNVLGRAARDDPAFFERGLMYLLHPPFKACPGILESDH